MDLKEQLDLRTFKSWFVSLVRLAEAAEVQFETVRQRIGPATRFLNRSSAWLPLAGFFVGVLLLLSRGLPLVTDAQFYIEDGPEFYGNAFNLGWGTLGRAYRGYFHLIARLIASTATLFPVQFGPLILVVSAIVIQAGVAAFFLSNRMSKQLPSVWIRLFLWLLIVGYPNSDELYGNIAHSQWFLGLLGVGLLYAEPALTKLERLRDLLLLAAITLTGPFAPVLALLAWFQVKGEGRYRWASAVIPTLASLLIPYAYKVSYRAPVEGHLGRIPMLLRMAANQILVGPLQGLTGIQHRSFDSLFNVADTLDCLAITGLLVYGLIRGPSLLRGLMVLGMATVVAAAKTSPWRLLGAAGVGERYFFVIGFSLVVALAFIAWRPGPALPRWVGRFACLYCLFGIASNWLYAPPYRELDFGPQIAGFDRVRRGKYLEILTPIDRKSPTSWVTRLRKP